MWQYCKAEKINTVKEDHALRHSALIGVQVHCALCICKKTSCVVVPGCSNSPFPPFHVQPNQQHIWPNPRLGKVSLKFNVFKA